MKQLHKVLDVKCPICRNGPGHHCTDRPLYASGPKSTVKAHRERYQELRDELKAASRQIDLPTSADLDATEQERTIAERTNLGE